MSRGLWRYAGRRTKRNLTLLWAALFVFSLVLQYVNLATPRSAFAATAGFIFPGSAVAGGAWDNPGGATSEGGTVANADADNEDQSYTGFAFGLQPGTIIDGITVEASASTTDTSGCQLQVRLSPDGGTTWTNRQTANLNTSGLSLFTLGSGSDTWGRTWDPTELTTTAFRLELRANQGTGCTVGADYVKVDYVAVKISSRTIANGTTNGALSSAVCDTADFNFIVDMSGSIAQQGSNPSNLPDLKAGIIGFVNAFQSAGGDGRYSATRFNGSSSATLTNGYIQAGPFTVANGPIDGLTGPTGLTPTSAGITTGISNNTNDRAGVPNIMFVVTDGSPNKPNTHGDDLGIPETWLQGANAAIAAADTARAGSGASKYVVMAVYLSTPTDPGDTSMPFSEPGRSQWAGAVMTEVGGGSFMDSDFSDFVDDLFTAIGCPPPSVQITKTANPLGPVGAGSTIGFDINVTNAGGKTATNVVVTDNLPGTAGLDWSIVPAVSGCAINGAVGSEVLTCTFASLAVNAVKTIHVQSGTTGASCATIPNTASFTTGNDGSGNASASVVVQCPNVTVAKTPDNGSVQAGDPAVFTIVVTNQGPGIATGVTLDDDLPAGYVWSLGGTNAASCSIDTAPSPDKLHCSFGDVAANTSRTVTLSAPTSGANCAVIPNTATVGATNEPQANKGDDSDSGSIDVLCGNVGITKTADASPVSAGSDIGFTVTVTNNGDGEARGVTVADTLPANISGWQISPASSGWSIVGGVLKFGPATLAAGASSSVHVVGSTDPSDCGTVPNSATVTTTNDGGGTASASVVVQCPDIHVAKTANPAGPVSAGDKIGFDVTISNTGTGSASGAQATDNLPGSGWAIVGAANGWSLNGSTLSFGPATLAAGQSRTVHVERTAAPADCGTVDNTVTGFATNEPAASQPNSASASVVVQCPDIHVAKTANPAGPVTAGDKIGFDVTISNSGPGMAHGAQASDSLPGSGWAIVGPANGWTLVGSSLTFGPADLAASQSRTVHVERTSTPADCGTVNNTVTGFATNEPASSQPNTASASVVVDCPDVTVEKTADVSPISAGEVASFTITVTNLGPGTAKGVTLDDPLPDGVDWILDAPVAGCDIDAGVLSCSFASLLPGAQNAIVIHVAGETDFADCEGLPNTVTVDAANEAASKAGNNEDSATIDVDCPLIGIAKTADHDGPVSAGDQIGFTVTLANSGDGSAFDVSADDALPTGYAWTIESQDGGWSINQAGHLVWGPATLGAHAQTAVHIVATSSNADCGLVPNAAAAFLGGQPADDDSAAEEVDCPDITVTKVADDASVSAGDQIGFTVEISNAGPGTAHAAFATDTLPGAGWTIESQDGGWKIEAGVLSFAGDLADGASSSVHVVRDSTPEDCGTVTNTVTVGAANEDPEATGNDTASASTDVDCPDITVTKVADDASVSAGDQIGFTVEISNAGPGTAHAAFATDTLPGAGWTIESQDGGWKIEAGVLSFAGDLADGASSSVHVVRDSTPEDCGTVTNTVTVGAANEDPEATGNDTASASTDVDCPDITVEKTADVSPIDAGEVAAFTIEVWNGGPGTAHDVSLTDTLPAGVDWVVDGTTPDGIDCTIEGQTLTCELGDLAPESEGNGNHVFIHLSGETSVLGCVEGDFELLNSVVVAASNEPADDQLPNEDDATVEVLCPDLLIGKTADHADPVAAGNAIGFTVTIANNGDGTAFDISVDDELPAGFDWTIESQDGGWSIASGHLTWGPDDLAAQSMSSVHIVAATDQDDCGLVPNEAFLSQDGQAVDDDSAAEEVDCPDIDIDKTSDTEVAGPGQTVHYTIDVFVDGEVAGGTVTDVLPDGQTYVADSQTSDPAAADFSVSSDGRTLTWTFDSTMSGDPAATIGYDVTIDADAASGAQTNEATFCVAIGPTGGSDEVVAAALDSPVNVADDLCDSDDQTIRVPELTIEKSVAGNSGGENDGGAPIALVDDTLTYTLTYTLTDGPVTDGVITDVLPAGLAYQSGTASDNDEFSFADYDEASRTLTWTADSVTEGGSLTYEVVVLDTAERDVDLTNVATIDSAETNPDDDDQTVTVPPTLTYGLVIDKSNDAPIETIDLGDGTTVDLPTANQGDTVTFTLDYTLTGDPVTNGVVTDVLPDGLAYVAGTATSNAEFTFVDYDETSRTLTWTADSVSASGSLSYDAIVEDGAAALAQPLVNVASIDSDQTDPDSDDSSVFTPETPEALTPPPTDTLDSPRTPGNPGFSLMLVLLALAGLTLGLGYVTPVPERVRRRDRRG